MRSVWRKCSDELPDGGWLVINSAGKIMRETPAGEHVEYDGDVESLIDIGAKIRRARVRAGMSQVELGNEIGVSQSMIRHWESAASSPTDETIERIKGALGYKQDGRSAGTDSGSAADATAVPSGKMMRTKAGFRRLRQQVGFTQVALAEALGIDSGKQHGTIDAIVKDWESPENDSVIPDKAWELLFALRKREREDAARWVDTLVQMHHGTSEPIDLTYYRTQSEYERYSHRKGHYGLSNAMVRRVGDGLEGRGFLVRYVYPEKFMDGATQTFEEAMEKRRA